MTGFALLLVFFALVDFAIFLFEFLKGNTKRAFTISLLTFLVQVACILTLVFKGQI
jgi:hypothetical protein